MFAMEKRRMFHRILLVDDSLSDGLLIRRAFREAGLDDPLCQITDSREAQAYLAGQDQYADREKFPIPEVLLLDLRMPEIDGFQLLKWIRSQPHLSGLFIILLTGMRDPRLIRMAYQLGANSFLAKDAALAEVRELVTYLREYSHLTGLSAGIGTAHCR